jgi:hypothetical protein
VRWKKFVRSPKEIPEVVEVVEIPVFQTDMAQPNAARHRSCTPVSRACEQAGEHRLLPIRDGNPATYTNG